MRHPAQALLRNLNRLANLPFETRDELRCVDAIVVLGAPLRRDGTLSRVTRERVELGVAHWHAKLAPLLVFTGGMVWGAVGAEAPAMADYAKELGVPAKAIMIEDQSKTTFENAVFTARLLRELEAQSVWIVSQPFHLRRGRRLFRKQGLNAHARTPDESIQFERPVLGLRWVAREYVAWLAHAISPRH